MEMTEAATTPVVAASRAPTRITAMAKPPRRGPNSWPMVSSKSSAMPLRSSIKPISVKNGMANSVSFCMMPNSRSGSACNNDSGRMPSSMPTNPKNKPQAPKLKATGKPKSRKTISPPNMMGAMLLMRNSMCVSWVKPRRLWLLFLQRAFESPRPTLLQGSSRPSCGSGLRSGPAKRPGV